MRNPTILSLFPLISLFPALTYCVPPRLLSLVYEGTGCPDNSISSTVTPVNFSSPNPTSSLTLLYTALTPSISPSVPTTETRTHCTVEIGLGWGDETPSGSSGNWEFSVLHTAVLGQNDPIDRGVGIHFSFLYDISGAGNVDDADLKFRRPLADGGFGVVVPDGEFCGSGTGALFGVWRCWEFGDRGKGEEDEDGGNAEWDVSG
ncbi:hypothetical protein M501DRAFT_1016224 [Patellaria atrata CBS 101060]|uniref:Ubiquitin 3 binding protein But2 C-terminal domain-containing protein n=1 Tax=Patellaria atrata CBS 101060 TaxID=1346257 RepID=A0A9P4SC91_9PEZI|nr:hypothetical protein M501DRAFT_1016224 [Patellaria atrata CBS 101060]